MPYPMSAARGGLGQGGAAWTPTFLLRDDFTTTAAAPLASPRTAEPGPGTLTIVDGNSKLSVSGGKLSFATGGVGSGDPGAWNNVISTRQAGRTIFAEVTIAVAGIYIGWDTNQLGGITDAVLFNTSSVIHARVNSTNVDVGSYSTSTSYKVALVQRGTGFLAFIKGGAFTSWTLLYTYDAGTGSVYAGMSVLGATSVLASDYLRVLDLAAPFSTDYGIATQRLSGARSALDSFVDEANCVIEFTDTTRPSASNLDFRFRRQDATNYWQVTIDSTGAFTLNEVVAGTPTQHATAAGVVSSGHRIVIVADSTTIRGYSNNVLRWTYSSASNFATATAGELTALGTSGAVSDVIAWPRQLSGTAASYLDSAVA